MSQTRLVGLVLRLGRCRRSLPALRRYSCVYRRDKTGPERPPSGLAVADARRAEESCKTRQGATIFWCRYCGDRYSEPLSLGLTTCNLKL